MQFQEKDLVNLIEDNEYSILEHRPSNRRGPSRFSSTPRWGLTREAVLPSGRRMDLLFRTKSARIHWIVECKVIAEPSAIRQAFEYRDELVRTLCKPGRYRFRATFVTIAAQYFKPETLFFAEQLGVQCLLIAPINFEELHISEVRAFDVKAQLRAGGFYV